MTDNADTLSAVLLELLERRHREALMQQAAIVEVQAELDRMQLDTTNRQQLAKLDGEVNRLEVELARVTAERDKARADRDQQRADRNQAVDELGKALFELDQVRRAGVMGPNGYDGNA